MSADSGSIAQYRAVVVLAFIDELDANPELLTAWAREFSDADPITLVIHPSDWPPADVADAAQRIVTASGLANGPETAHLVALTGPLTERDTEVLRGRCIAVYGEIATPSAFGDLLQVEPDRISTLRLQLPAPVKTPPAPGAEPASEEMTEPEAEHITIAINDTVSITLRDTTVDREVMGQIFRDQSYSLERLSSWPGIQRVSRATASGARPLIVDAGANFGASCIYFGLRFPQATIVAVEPEPANFRLLQRNAGQFTHAHPLEAALAARPGTLKLTDPGIGAWGFRAGNDVAEGRVIGEVAAITIDEVLAVAPEAAPFILKVDIEGAEGGLFDDPAHALNDFPLVIIELHDWMMPAKETSRSFLRWHLAHDRDLFSLGENLFSIASDLRTA